MEKSATSHNENKKVVMITSLLPFSNYSSLLIDSYNFNDGPEFIIYCEKEVSPLKKAKVQIKPLWQKKLSFFQTVINELQKDKPDIVHIQFEMNMFGNIFTNALFPLFLLLLRTFRFKVIFTMHSVVPLDLIDKNFIQLFRGDNSKLPAWTLKLFFHYLNGSVKLLCDKVIVHTNLLKEWLVTDYNFDPSQIEVVSMGVPQFYTSSTKSSEKYFFYFGYFARRKGLENVLKGFADFSKSHPEFYLYMAGGVITGQDFALDEFKQQVKSYGIEEKVKFIGYLKNREDFDKYFTGAYCCVIPAVITISASGPLSKVFGYHKCVIASKIGNFNEEIEHKVDGYLTDNDAWSMALTELAENPQLVENIEKGSARKADLRSWVNVARFHKDLYSNFLLE